MIYNLYYKDILIGYIETLNDEYKYTPIENTNVSNSILADLKKEASGKIIDFPFLESRIRYMNEFNLDTIKYETDFYKLEKNQ